VALAEERAAPVQVASCSEWAVCRAMKVRVASRMCGLEESRRKGRRGNGQEKGKGPESGFPDWVPAGSPIGMNFARPIPAERIRCLWRVKECAAVGLIVGVEEVASGEWPATAGRRVTSLRKKQIPPAVRRARNDNSRGVGALVLRWKKRKRRSRAPERVGMNSARPLQGLVVKREGEAVEQAELQAEVPAWVPGR
jgi:hypothetical protein